MRGRARESDQFALVEDRHDEAHVWLMRGAVVRVVMDHHVAWLPLLFRLAEATLDTAHVARDWTRLQRSRLDRLAELVRVDVAEGTAKIF